MLIGAGQARPILPDISPLAIAEAVVVALLMGRALALSAVALAVAYRRLSNLWRGVPLYALGTWLRVAEERLLRMRFGPAYDACAARANRLVPQLF